MRKNLIALGITLGGILYAAIWTIIFYFNFNYREIGEADDLIVYSVMFICFYNFGVYISAAIFRLLSKRERDIVPSTLVYGSIRGWVLGFSIIFLPIFVILCTIFIDGIIYLFSVVWVIFLLPQLVIIQAVGKYDNKYISSKRVFFKDCHCITD